MRGGGNSSEPWEYSQKFDFIHTRVTAGCWNSFQTQVAEQALETLEPGGWFESHEYDADFSCDDGTLNPHGAMMIWSQNMISAGEAVGRPMCFGKELKRIYQEVGFVDVTERVFKIPTNPWAKDEKLKELGRLWEWNYARGVSAFSYGLFNRAFQMTREQIEVSSDVTLLLLLCFMPLQPLANALGLPQVSLVDVRRELSDTRVHAYVNLYAIWGRKPFPGEGQNAAPIFRAS